MGIPQISIIFTIILSIIVPIISPKPILQKYFIRNTINDILIIEKENKGLSLRGITKNNVNLYRKPNVNSISFFSLDCGDIIEVLKIKKKWIYVRLYKTDIEGWILKKYTK